MIVYPHSLASSCPLHAFKLNITSITVLSTCCQALKLMPTNSNLWLAYCNQNSLLERASEIRYLQICTIQLKSACLYHYLHSFWVTKWTTTSAKLVPYWSYSKLLCNRCCISNIDLLHTALSVIIHYSYTVQHRYPKYSVSSDHAIKSNHNSDNTNRWNSLIYLFITSACDSALLIIKLNTICTKPLVTHAYSLFLTQLVPILLWSNMMNHI